MTSHDSTPSSPVSTSSTLTEERSTRTMADVIKDYDTNELIDYLCRQDLKLDNKDISILRKQKISGFDFLELTKEDFRSIGFALGPATRLTKFIEGLGQKLRSFSSYKTLEELKDVLRKYKVNGEDITNIKQFTPDSVEIDNNDKALDQCMNEITLRLTNLETMQTNANEATRCVFITSILNASLAIVRRITNEEELYISYQKAVSGEEASGRVDYAIKGNEDLMCIAEGKPRNIEIGYLQNIMQLESAYHTNKKKRTADEAFKDDYDYLYGIVSTATEWHFIIYTTEGIYSTSKSEYQINLSKMALKEDLSSIRKGVKRVLGVIVGLLKDRVSVDNSPTSKKARIEKFIK